MDVGDICTRSVISIRGDETVTTAVERMRRFHVGDLVVTDPDEARPRPIGVLTDRDVAVGIVAATPEAVASLRCDEALRGQVVTVDETDDVFDAIETMHRERIRRLPVVDESGELIGILSMDDVYGVLARAMAKLADIPAAQRDDEWEDRP